MKELIVEAKRENLLKVQEFIDEQLEAVGCPTPIQTSIDIAVEELFVNIASYAYAPGTGDITVRVDFDADSRTVTLTFIDSGVPYDPLQKPDPDVTLAVEEREVGGLGIFMVKKSMDDMAYARRDGRNEVTIRKRI